MSNLLTIDEALARVLEHAVALESEEVAVAKAYGRVLSDDAVAASDLPPFDSSAMDGYAVRAADTPGRLRVVGHSAAGRPAGRGVAAGEAIEISTGAVVPEGADAVVPIERIAGGGEQIEAEYVAQGDNVRPRGGDARAGETVAPAGLVLGPVHVGALAAAGVATVRCARAPRIAVLATGTELRAPGEPLGPGEIYESNSLLLAAQVASAGAKAVVHAAVDDDEDATREALARCLDADVVLTSGGVSVGRHDLVRSLLAELGVEEVFWGVAVRPGKPLFFGTSGRTLVFGLPGNPVSSLVGFELFVRPALAALQGAAEPGPLYLPGRLRHARRRNAARGELARATARVEDGAVVLDLLEGQESHMIVRGARADALVLVPRGEGELPAGSHVSYVRV
jgi:molybdopterin molybdotransferase